MNPAGLFLVAAGLFSVCGAVLDWNFFFSSRRARLLVSLMGRRGARFFYGLIGSVISILGTLITFGIIRDGG